MLEVRCQGKRAQYDANLGHYSDQFNVTEHGGRVDVGLIMTVSFQSSRVLFLNGSSDSFRPFYSRRPLANRKIEYAEVTRVFSVISPTPKLPSFCIFDFRDEKELLLLAFPCDAITFHRLIYGKFIPPVWQIVDMVRAATASIEFYLLINRLTTTRVHYAKQWFHVEKKYLS
jgi:hypothetical protein